MGRRCTQCYCGNSNCTLCTKRKYHHAQWRKRRKKVHWMLGFWEVAGKYFQVKSSLNMIGIIR